MGDGIRGHEQLEAEEARQQVLVDVVAPRAELLLPLELLANEIEHAIEEGGGAGGGIEDEDAMRGFLDLLFPLPPSDGDGAAVGEPVLEAELAFQQEVEALDDVVHHRLRGVIDAAQFAQLWVIRLEEGLVEVDDGIAASAALAEIGEDVVHARDIECLNDVVHEAGEGFVFQRRAGDLLEEMAEEGIGARDQLARLVASETPARPGGAGGKKAVGEGLRKHVGKLGADFGFLFCIRLDGQLGEERGGKGRAPVAELIGGFAVGKGFNDGIAHQVGEVGKAQGELRGRGDGNGPLREETLEELEGLGLLVGIGDNLAAGSDASERGGSAFFRAALALHVPADFEVIGEEEIRKVRLIALELLALFDLGEIDADVLRLDVAEREAVLAPRDDVIRRAALDALGFIGGIHFRERLDERLKRGAIGVLGGVATLPRPLDLGEILRWRHAHRLGAKRAPVERVISPWVSAW